MVIFIRYKAYMEDNDILKNLKSLFSWIWRPAKTQEEKVIKRYDTIIALCVIFMIGYLGFSVFSFDRKESVNITNITSAASEDPNYNVAIYNGPDTKLTPFYTTNSLTDKEYYIGEIVGVRYFGIFGLVRQKTLGTHGYTYTVRYENTEHDLMNDEFEAWELYRPQAGSVPISVLRQ